MERGVVIFRRVAHVFRQNGEKYYVLTPLGLEVEPVTLEMAERMRREAEMAKVKAPGDVPASSKGLRLRGKEVSAVPHDRGAKAKE